MEQIKANFSGKTIFCGLDVHKASWNLGIHLDDVFLRNVHQKPNPKVLLDFLQKNYPGATYKTAYEAGKFGFWIHRQLTALGIECLVVTLPIFPNHRKISSKKRMPTTRETSAFAYRKASSEVYTCLMSSKRPTAASSAIERKY